MQEIKMASQDNLKYIIESLLFVSDTPIMLKQIHYIMPDVKMSHIRKAVESLTHEYNERGGSFYLSNVAGGIQLRTRPMYKDWIKRFIKSRPMRLSRAALEALAIVAYKQPVTRSEVDKIRGVDSGAIMRTLVENRLIRIIGRKEVAGRPMLYTTSKRFLEVFDLNDLKDLPAPDDLEIDDADVIVDNDETNVENNELPVKPVESKENIVENNEHAPDIVVMNDLPENNEQAVEHTVDDVQTENIVEDNEHAADIVFMNDLPENNEQAVEHTVDDVQTENIVEDNEHAADIVFMNDLPENNEQAVEHTVDDVQTENIVEDNEHAADCIEANERSENNIENNEKAGEPNPNREGEKKELAVKDCSKNMFPIE